MSLYYAFQTKYPAFTTSFSRLVKTVPSVAAFMSSLTIMTVALDRHRIIVKSHKTQVSTVIRVKLLSIFHGGLLVQAASMDAKLALVFLVFNRYESTLTLGWVSIFLSLLLYLNGQPYFEPVRRNSDLFWQRPSFGHYPTPLVNRCCIYLHGLVLL